ncbi:SixA phosphatase family protein [Urechidicola croceus]|uniref:Histidine phosphatase family protein n=1 Tax=Urechidicola croceus TaxID=1850246 RepID=A0A1D8P6U0_9FLAO|nr:histidine phosphatase family protein [Urechidicola croceus]AOW20272.1 histidine phosphatase family protein [Urechidicola croceus]
MKTLYIVRHAKSSWEYDGIEDIDRPLKKRGINDAHLMSKILQEKIDRPDVFVSSCANRALHTGIIFSYAFKYPLANLKINKSLYSFSDGYLVKTIRALDDGFDSAMIFSHNHGINDFVNVFGSESILNVPTCGVVGIKFKTDHWKNIKKGKTFLIDFPKDYK